MDAPNPQVELAPPPGDWTGATSSTNDDRSKPPADRKAVLGSQSQWPDWDFVLQNLATFAQSGPFFLEPFAGKAGLTEAVHLTGVPVLPPVDIEPSALISTPRDLVDYVFWRQLLDLLALGIVFFLHCGRPAIRSPQPGRLMGGRHHYQDCEACSRRASHWQFAQTLGINYGGCG